MTPVKNQLMNDVKLVIRSAYHLIEKCNLALDNVEHELLEAWREAVDKYGKK